MTNENQSSFNCSGCRKDIDIIKFKNVLKTVSYKVSSFGPLIELLPMSLDMINDLFGSLILKYEFDIIKIEQVLFNIASLVQIKEEVDLSFVEKQEIYKQARQPIDIMYIELKVLKLSLEELLEFGTYEWKKREKLVQNQLDRIQEASKNAAFDIYERMNSIGLMGIKSSGVLKIDFHGLHVKEAIEKINEIILPVISELKVILIVTGHGKHSNSGDSLLQNGIIKFFQQTPEIGCNILKENSGVLEIKYFE